MELDKQLSFKIPQSLYNDIEELATAEGFLPTPYLRSILIKAVQELKKKAKLNKVAEAEQEYKKKSDS